MANAPILFINEDRIAAIKRRAIKNCISVNSLPPISFPTRPAIPELLNPWLIMRTRATVITAGCANPANASFAGIISRTTKTNNAPTAKASYLIFPQINKKRRAINVEESTI